MAHKSIDWGWFQVAFGSASVIVVAVFYVLSPPLAISANLGVDFEAARQATLLDHGFLRIAGMFGAMGDPIITVGALSAAVDLHRSGSMLRAHGLYWLGAVALLYTIYDAMAGFALVPAAQGGAATFGVVKPLIDALLCGASFGYGISGIMAGWPMTSEPPLGPRWLMIGLLLAGLLLIGSSVATIIGMDGGLAIGVGLTVMTTLYTVLGAVNLRTARLKAR